MFHPGPLRRGGGFDDGAFGIPDLKTCFVKDDYVPLYGRQLHSYAYAVENPAPGKLSFKPVTELGLIVFEPAAFIARNGFASFMGGVTWVPVKRDDALLFALLDDVLTVLEQPTPPPPGDDCVWCRWPTVGGSPR